MEIGKLEKINEKTNNNIVHGFRLGKTNGSTRKTFDTGT